MNKNCISNNESFLFYLSSKFDIKIFEKFYLIFFQQIFTLISSLSSIFFISSTLFELTGNFFNFDNFFKLISIKTDLLSKKNLKIKFRALNKFH